MKEFKRINKTVARRLYNEGKIIYLHPCKVHPNSAWMPPTPFIKVTDQTEFGKLVNAFEYYNCDNERGRYCAYYIPV